MNPAHDLSGKHSGRYDHVTDMLAGLMWADRGRHRRSLPFGLCLTGSELRVLVANRCAPLAEKRLECRGVE